MVLEKGRVIKSDHLFNFFRLFEDKCFIFYASSHVFIVFPAVHCAYFRAMSLPAGQ